MSARGPRLGYLSLWKLRYRSVSVLQVHDFLYGDDTCKLMAIVYNKTSRQVIVTYLIFLDNRTCIRGY